MVVKKLRDAINTNGIQTYAKPLLILFLGGLFTWIIVSARDLPINYATKTELKSLKVEINTERDATRKVEHIAIKESMDIGFDNIEKSLQRHEAKIDEIFKYIVQRNRAHSGEGVVNNGRGG